MNQENQLAKRTTTIVEEFGETGVVTAQIAKPNSNETNVYVAENREETKSEYKFLGIPEWIGIISVILMMLFWVFPSPISLSSWWLTPTLNEFEIGNSTLGYSLNGIQIGNGPNRFLLIGGIHGNESFSTEIVLELAKYFQDNAKLVPLSTTLYFLPLLNPDSYKKQRMTSTGVDLNRNWQTDSWKKDAPQPDGKTISGSGGNTPFSEPETAALSTWLLNRKEDSDSIRIISYHTHVNVPNPGRVQPGYIEHGRLHDLSDDLAKRLEAAGYTYRSTCCEEQGYIPTGEFINWAATKGITIVEVELPSNGIATVAGKQAAIQKALESIIAVVDMLD